MGIGFDNTAVHIGPRVSFVGITYDVFGVLFGLAAQFPLETGRKSSAAPTPKTGFFYLFDNPIRSHLGQSLGQGLVAISGYIFVDDLGVDQTSVSKSDQSLAREKADVHHLGDSQSLLRGSEHKFFYRPAL